AVQYIAAQAKLSDYDVRVVPRPKHFLEHLPEEATGGKEDTRHLDLAAPLPPAGRRASLVELAMPYLRNLDPQRVEVVKAALRRLELARQEGVLMMMPEMLLAN